MQQDIVGQVLSVTGRPTKRGGTIFDIAFSDGNKYTCFDGGLAQKANSLVGQQVSARVSVEQKGQYTNFNLLDIAPQGQLAPAAMPAPGGTPIVPIAQGAPIPIQPRGGMDPAREAKIVKQSSFSTAFGFVSSLFQGAGPEALSEAKDLAYALSHELYDHVLGATTPLGGSQLASNGLGGATPTPTTPEGVADTVNAAAGTPVVGVGAEVPVSEGGSGVIPW